jgi:hypothetical protein
MEWLSYCLLALQITNDMSIEIRHQGSIPIPTQQIIFLRVLFDEELRTTFHVKFNLSDLTLGQI